MKRQLSLDLLRGVAVLLVIVCHCHVTEPILATIKCGGWVGVDLFFVLSGFLVSGLLFKQQAKEGRIRPINFWVRRGFKIYPAFWVFIAITVMSFFVTNHYIPWDKLGGELLFVQSYTKTRLWGHTWSLAVEEHFYFLLPLILMPLAKVNFKPLPRMVFTMMGGLALAKWLNSFQPVEPQITFYTHLRIDALFFGVLLSHWHHSWPAFTAFCHKYSGLLFIAGCSVFVPAFMFNVYETRYLYSFGYTVNTLGAGAILMSMVCGNVPVNCVTKLVAWIGEYSYSIYLWHNFALIGIIPILGVTEALEVYATVVVSCALGIVMSRLVEGPALKLRDALTQPQQPWLMPSPALLQPQVHA
jgi:peptidoglycan/LPS O-acetylase OafA/YrhL